MFARHVHRTCSTIASGTHSNPKARGKNANVVASTARLAESEGLTVSETKGEVLELGQVFPPGLPEIKEPKRVVLVRHGESTWNATGRIQGSSDFSELTEKGMSQAETSRQMLLADNFDICFHR